MCGREAGGLATRTDIATMETDEPDPEFNAATARLLRREALRRAAQELNTTSGPGLESVLEKISAEVTAEALEKRDDLKAKQPR